MINRIPHKIRIPLTYMPVGIESLVMSLFFLAREINNPIPAQVNFIELLRKIIQSNQDSKHLFMYLIKMFILFLPSIFSLTMVAYTLIQNSKLSRYDKKNGTRLSESYYDETYNNNINRSLILSVTAFFAIMSISLMLFIFTNILPRIFFVYEEIFVIALMFSLCIFCISFVIYEVSITKNPHKLEMESDYV